MLKVHAKNLETVAVLYLEGRIVTGETEPLRNGMPYLEGKREVILDLTQVTTVDAHGLGVLLQLREQALTKGAHMKLMNVSNPIHQVLEITHLDSVFPTVPAVEFFPIVSTDRRTPVAA
jgi:anti-anti-sigma factor